MFSAPQSEDARQRENYFVRRIHWLLHIDYDELYRSLQVLTFYETGVKHFRTSTLDQQTLYHQIRKFKYAL